jgi:hypothetical protein
LWAAKPGRTALADPAQMHKAVQIEGNQGTEYPHSMVKQLDGQAKADTQATNIANLLKKEEIF